jgi:hypothetical protein
LIFELRKILFANEISVFLSDDAISKVAHDIVG